jgi:hypothetical protein
MFFQVVLIMLNYVSIDSQKIILSSLFLNICTSVSCSVINALWLFNLLDWILSENDSSSNILLELMNYRNDWNGSGINLG